MKGASRAPPALGRAANEWRVVSARSPGELYYADELPGPETVVVYTRQTPPGAGRTAGRIAVADVAPLVRGDEDVYVCGSPGFADPTDRQRARKSGHTPMGVWWRLQCD